MPAPAKWGASLILHPDRHIFLRQVLLIPNGNRALLNADRIIARLF